MLFTVGAEADGDRIELLLSQVKGKDITELIASGREKLASVPSGGGAVAVASPASGGGGAAPAAAEQKKEEKVEEKEESDDVSIDVLYFRCSFSLYLDSLFISLNGSNWILNVYILLTCYIILLQDMGFSLFD